ncbi:MAG TPA: hypothetical protein VLA89_08140 [Gemmatimonadales bacterium]|nr:hypothetical protein [Gemmatimonadales bacterium]
MSESQKSWVRSEVGRYIRGESSQFNGGILKTWLTDCQAAVTAGAPYPEMKPVLKQWILDYLIEIA